MTYFHPEVGCLFHEDHEPTHPIDLRFHAMNPLTGQWQDMTEMEMVNRLRELRMNGMGNTGGILTSSTFDWWWEEKGIPWPAFPAPPVLDYCGVTGTIVGECGCLECEPDDHSDCCERD